MYAGAVEQEIPYTATLVRTITSRRSDQLNKFIDVWEAQEAGHGVILDHIATNLGIECFPRVDKTAAKMKALGLVARCSGMVADIVQHIYLVDGAIAEDETMTAYRLIARTLDEHGESNIAAPLMDIAAQEARHRAYYIDAVKESDASKLTVAATKLFVERSYLPVGIPSGNVERMVMFGDAVLGTVGEDYHIVTDSAEALAYNLVGARPGFLSKSYGKCVEMAKVAT